MRLKRTFQLMLAGLALLISGSAAQAGTYTWDNTSANWSDGTQWSSLVAPSGSNPNDILIFGGSGTTSYTATNDITSPTPFLLNQLQLTSTASVGETITGQQLRFGGIAPTINQTGAGAFTIANNIDLAADLTLAGYGTSPGSAGAGGVTLSGVITGSNAIVKTGVSAYTLSGAGTTYSGAIKVHDGALTFSGSTPVASGVTNSVLILAGPGTAGNSQSINVSGGAIFRLDNSGTVVLDRVSNTAAVTLGGGTFDFLSNNSATTSETVGTLYLASGASTVNVSGSTGAFASTLTFNGIDMVDRPVGSTLNFTNTNGTLGTAGNNPQIILSGTSAGLLGGWAIVNGADFAYYNATTGVQALGTTLGTRATQVSGAASTDNVQTGANAQTTLSANTTINSLAINGAIGTFTLNSGKTLTILTGGIIKSGNSTSVTITGGNITAGSTANAELSIYVAASNALSIKSTIVDNFGGPVNVIKSGPGTLTLSAAQGFSGNFYLNGGTVKFSGTPSLESTTALVFMNPTDFQFGGIPGFATAFGGLRGVSGSILENNSGGALTVIIDIPSPRNDEYDGSIIDTSNGSRAGALGITKTDAGSLTLTGGNGNPLYLVTTSSPAVNIAATGNTYSGGTTISGGTIYANCTAAGGSSTGSGFVTVNAGSTLAGIGNVLPANGNAVTINGTLAPGGSTAPGRLTIGSSGNANNLTFNTGSFFEVRLNGNSAGSGYDQLVFAGSGTLTLGGNAILTPTLGYAPANSDMLFIIVNQSGNPISGTFNNQSDGSTVILGNYTATINYFGSFTNGTLTGGNDVVLSNFIAVPEPGLGLALAIGLGLARMGRGSRRVLR